MLAFKQLQWFFKWKINKRHGQVSHVLVSMLCWFAVFIICILIFQFYVADVDQALFCSGTLLLFHLHHSICVRVWIRFVSFISCFILIVSSFDIVSILLPPFVLFPPHVVSLMCLTCVWLLPRPLVYISQIFCPQPPTLSSCLSGFTVDSEFWDLLCWFCTSPVDFVCFWHVGLIKKLLSTWVYLSVGSWPSCRPLGSPRFSFQTSSRCIMTYSRCVYVVMDPPLMWISFICARVLAQSSGSF